jgi:hypothetical protein
VSFIFFGVGQTDAVDEWVWYLVTVSGVPHSPDDDEAETFSTLCTIMSVDVEWSSPVLLRFPLWYELWRMGCQTAYPTISIFGDSE